jgi:hypothetical protein
LGKLTGQRTTNINLFKCHRTETRCCALSLKWIVAVTPYQSPLGLDKMSHECADGVGEPDAQFRSDMRRLIFTWRPSAEKGSINV